jgi:hypothetical protein
VKNLDGQKSEKYANMNFEIDEDKIESQIYYTPKNYTIFLSVGFSSKNIYKLDKFVNDLDDGFLMQMILKLDEYTF